MARASSRLALAVYAIAIVVVATDPEPAGAGLANDKLLHGLAYAIFAALAYRAAGGSAAWSIGLAALHGCGVEWLQRAVPGRHASFGDVAADLVGALVGFGAAAAWHEMRRRSGSGARRGET